MSFFTWLILPDTNDEKFARIESIYSWPASKNGFQKIIRILRTIIEIIFYWIMTPA